MTTTAEKSPATLEIDRILNELSEESQRLVSAVFEIEQAHLSEKQPIKTHVTREIVKATKAAVQ